MISTDNSLQIWCPVATVKVHVASCMQRLDPDSLLGVESNSVFQLLLFTFCNLFLLVIVVVQGTGTCVAGAV